MPALCALAKSRTLAVRPCDGYPDTGQVMGESGRQKRVGVIFTYCVRGSFSNTPVLALQSGYAKPC
jgi:hypothetical protein